MCVLLGFPFGNEALSLVSKYVQIGLELRNGVSKVTKYLQGLGFMERAGCVFGTEVWKRGKFKNSPCSYGYCSITGYPPTNGVQQWGHRQGVNYVSWRRSPATRRDKKLETSLKIRKIRSPLHA